MPSAWTHLRAAVDPLVRPYHLYTAYPLTDAEHIGTVAGESIRDARRALGMAGYEPQYLSAAKRHPETGALHDLSYRKVPDIHPVFDPIVSGGLKPYDAEQCQLHVHAFDVPDGVAFYSHYELRPDLRPVAGETIGEAYRRLRTHYRPEYGDTYLRGVTDLPL